MSFRSFTRLYHLAKPLGPRVASRTLFPVRKPIIPYKQGLRYYIKDNTTTKIETLTSSPQVLAHAKSEKKVGKLKELAQKYGAAGVIVYLGIGMIDLGAVLLAIEFAGLDKVKQVEASAMDILNSAKTYVGLPVKETPPEAKNIEETPQSEEEERPSFTSIFLLAYTIHKTLFLPVRLTVTAAITPAVVRKLHQLGWAKYAPRFLGGTAIAATKP
ncbi:hypothetical protein BDF14DRAFT_1783224 [Spinellus fusiger]|nr:hypothetical protein BDF14DRAFT_1783224 [Spinellus fusiger]